MRRIGQQADERGSLSALFKLSFCFAVLPPAFCRLQCGPENHKNSVSLEIKLKSSIASFL